MCDIIFKTAMSTKNEIFVEIDRTEPIDLGDFSVNGLWDLTNSSAVNLGESTDDDFITTKIKFSVRL